jgi:hypothetical protein
MIGLAGDREAQPVLSRETNRLAAADLRNPLPDSELTVVGQAGAVFTHDPAVGSWMDVPNLDLIEIVRQQLQAVRVDSAQVCRDQGPRDQVSLFRRYVGRDEEFVCKACK